jgi:hypothetical protein
MVDLDDFDWLFMVDFGWLFMAGREGRRGGEKKKKKNVNR